MSLNEMSARMAALGVPLSLNSLSKVETGKRPLDLDELVAAARALEVLPLLLIFPLGHEEAVEVLPGVTEDTWQAAAWFTGEGNPPGEHGDVGLKGQPTSYFRRQAHLIESWNGARRDDDAAEMRHHEEVLRYHREVMRMKGLNPGALPAELAHIEDGDSGQR